LIAYLDLAGGLSGDMFIAAFLDAGLEAGQLTAVLQGLNLGPWSLDQGKATVFGLEAGQVRFTTEPSPPHRDYALTRDQIIRPADLPARVKDLALRAFEKLAQVEAKVHGTTAEKVHFHEVGADDSILDLVGAAACLYLAQVEEFIASPVPLSRGTGQSQHGRLPLPAPATLELLKGRPVHGTGAVQELVTPTGAAILTWADSFGQLPAMELTAVGAGVGQRPPQLGLTRLCLGRPLRAGLTSLAQSERTAVLTAFIDDMNPELYGPLMEALFEQGALDVALSPVQMKKNRPGVRLEVLARPEEADALARLILEDSTSLGLRLRVEDRLCLERRPGSVEVEGQKVDGKWVRKPSDRWEFRPEFEACRALAARLKQPVGRVYTQAQAAAEGKKP